MENDIGRQYVSNYCPKSKKLNPWLPKPLNIDIGQSFPTIGSIESLKKIVPQQHYFCQFLFSIVSIHDCHFVKQINFELFIMYAKLLAWLIQFLEYLFPPTHRPACAKNLNPLFPTIHFNPHLVRVEMTIWLVQHGPTNLSGSPIFTLHLILCWPDKLSVTMQ